MTGLADAACRGRAEELRLGVERAKLDLGRYHGQQEEEDGEPRLTMLAGGELAKRRRRVRAKGASLGQPQAAAHNLKDCKSPEEQ